MGKKKWVEQWLDPNDELKEVEVDPDVFYDYFLSIPTVKSQRYFKEYKTLFLAKIKDGDKKKFAQELGWTDDEDLEDLFDGWKKLYEEWEEEKCKLHNYENRVGEDASQRDDAEEKKITKKVRRIEKEMTEEIRGYFKEKTQIVGTFDTLCLKFFWAILINVVVVFMIYAIMNTLSSTGLPGRQRLPESSSFKVTLKVDPTVVTNQDRFDRPETITDICQGLGWWMEDPIFKLDPYTMPTDDALRDLTRQHWDRNLNTEYNCPAVVTGLANKLLGQENKYNCSKGVSPGSSTWTGDDETTEFFLFQDQTAYLTGSLARKDVYHKNGLTVTHKATNLKKQFSFMAGNYNGKVQHLQPIEPFQAKFYTTTKPITLYYNPFWVAQDRIWPSEWAVQALFTLDWNSDKAWDESVLVGGFNDFGRRPTAIVEANLGGSIGAVDRNGYKIQEAVWQFLERRCWHTDDRTAGRQPFSASNPQSYSAMNQYDLRATPRIKWDQLDQDLRDYWRALGLGIDTSRCPFVKTRVSTGNTCIEQEAGSTCQRVNYHSVQRWNAYNDEAIAARNFNNRDFTNIFYEYKCDSEKADGNVCLIKTPINGAPTRACLTWDKLELAENGKLLEAATALGYDQEEWDRHRADPLSLPPDNLVLGMENYLEGEAYFSTYFWTQITCSLIMVAVSIIEIRHMFVWFELTNTKDLFRFKLWSNNNFVWGTSCFVAIFSYVVIPVLLVMVSLLLILESGSVTDMIKDTLSLLFLNEINNYLQVRNAPEARKWKIMLKEVKLRSMTRAKSIFTLLLFIVFALLGWGASEQVYTGLWSRVHPSILFNTLRQRPFPEGQVAWALYLLTLGVVFAVFLVSKLIESGLDKLETSLSDFITKEEGKEKQGLFYKYIYLPASKVQGFVAETFNPDDDMDEDNDDWEEDCVVNSIAYSVDGSRLARSEGNDVVVCDVHDVVTGVEIRLKGHSEPVHSVAFSPDGRSLASGSYDNSVKIWDSASGECQKTLEGAEGHDGDVNSVAFSADGKLVASGSDDYTIKLWDVETGSCQNTLKGHENVVLSVTFSADGQLLASGSADKTIRLWDPALGSCKRTLEGHGDYVRSVAFSPDGQLLASGSDDTTIRLWDPALGSCKRTLEGHRKDNPKCKCKFYEHGQLEDSDPACPVMGHSDYVASVAFSPEGRLLASGSCDNSVKIWDSASGSYQHTLEGHVGDVNSVAFSADGKVIASGSDDGTMKLWDDFKGESVAVSTENRETPAPTLLLRPTPELTGEEKVSDMDEFKGESVSISKETPAPALLPPLLLRPTPELTREEKILRGSWSIQIFHGQQLDVLINQDTGRVLATRRPGDRSGNVQWLDDAPSALLGTYSRSSTPMPTGTYPTMMPPIVVRAGPTPPILGMV